MVSGWFIEATSRDEGVVAKTTNKMLVLVGEFVAKNGLSMFAYTLNLSTSFPLVKIVCQGVIDRHMSLSVQHLIAVK
jgi:hypothetical protein